VAPDGNAATSDAADASWRFGTDDLQRWAAYSGDYNPIHFDPAQARRLGMDTVVVHGMLAMLPVKSALAARCEALTGSWLRARTLLRNPLPLDRAYGLDIGERAGQVTFSARCRQTGNEFLRGNCAGLSHAPQSDDPAVFAECRVTPQLLRDFASLLPLDPMPAWIAADAAVFSDFIQHQVGALTEHVQARMPPGRSSAPGLLVHASHSVSFDRRWSAPSSGVLEYAVMTPTLMHGADQTVCSIVLDVREDGRATMQVEMSLVIKDGDSPREVATDKKTRAFGP